MEGSATFKAKKAGRHMIHVNRKFVSMVVEVRNETDYGSEKIHFVLKGKGFGVSQHIMQRVLNEHGLTEPCLKRRGKRSYVRYEWPLSDYMWHTDWSKFRGAWYLAFIDDKSRRVMAAGKFSNATEKNAIFLLHQAILGNAVCPVVVLSDKGTQFYNSKRNSKGKRPPSLFEQELEQLGIDYWTGRRRHPQTNGKMEKWFDTMKKWLKKHPERSLENFVEWYNKRRIHTSLHYKTPEVVYRESM
jgi:transposase InsO family protein